MPTARPIIDDDGHHERQLEELAVEGGQAEGDADRDNRQDQRDEGGDEGTEDDDQDQEGHAGADALTAGDFFLSQGVDLFIETAVAHRQDGEVGGGVLLGVKQRQDVRSVVGHVFERPDQRHRDDRRLAVGGDQSGGRFRVLSVELVVVDDAGDDRLVRAEGVGDTLDGLLERGIVDRHGRRLDDEGLGAASFFADAVLLEQVPALLRFRIVEEADIGRGVRRQDRLNHDSEDEEDDPGRDDEPGAAGADPRQPGGGEGVVQRRTFHQHAFHRSDTRALVSSQVTAPGGSSNSAGAGENDLEWVAVMVSGGSSVARR